MRVVVTGAGAVSPLGIGVGALARALHEPVDAIGPITRFSTAEMRTHLGAMVPGVEGKDDELAIRFGAIAAREALADARCDVKGSRVGIVVGSSVGSGRARLAELTDAIAAAIELGGPRVTVSTACSSSSTAVGVARDLLRAGSADVVLAGGTDVLSSELFAGFHALGVLGAKPCAPFSRSTGTTLGEGAGFFVLEREEDARARAARARAVVLGYGLSADAYHPTSPDPTGSGLARAIRFALADAGVAPGAVDYVNAHGTGTEANDPAEILAIGAALERVTLPISSSKSFLGHAQGAAGILELVLTLLALEAQRLPPTAHFGEPRRGAPPDPVPAPRAASVHVALSLNAAFGGANCAVLLGEPSVPPAPVTAMEPRPVWVLGGAVLAGTATEPAALLRALEAGRPIERRTVAPRLADDLPMADERGMDPSTRLLASACARALAAARVVPRGGLRERIALFTSVTAFSAASGGEFRRSVDERGLARLNATAFAKLVLNAPAGEVAKLMSLRGPTTTFTLGRGGGAFAIAQAADLLARRREVDCALAAAVDELAAEPAPGESDGVGALVLGAERPAGRAVRLRRFAVSAPGEGLAVAVRHVLAGARPDRVLCDVGDVGVAAPTLALTSLGIDAPAATTAIASVLAAELIRTGAASSVLVATRGGGASVALLLEGDEA